MTVLGITMGCPAGIGPELIIRLFASGKDLFHHGLQAVVIGDGEVLKNCCKTLGLPQPRLVPWQPGTPPGVDGIPVYEVSSLKDHDYCWGKPSKASGRAMSDYITRAVELAKQDAIDGIVTCPISKASLNAAGHSYPGHTEMLAALSGAPAPVMMMAGTKLRVTLATIHTSFSRVVKQLSIERIYQLIYDTHKALAQDFAISSPRLAVAALNPHAGEEGLFGNEEEILIAPAISKAQSLGINISGPLPADTVFYQAAQGVFDAVVCMYHDQGLIPFKLLHFEDGVNVTLGLPLVRTSVDHGTAYDIAGKGVANHLSLVEAVKMAALISANRKKLPGNTKERD